MDRKAVRTAGELCGAVIGAGFASGREVASFFARYGAWCWMGVAAAGTVLGGVCISMLRRPGRSGMPAAWENRWQGKIWTVLFAALLAAAGSAMLAGTGEIAALTLPFRGARWAGMAATAALGWRLARSGSGGTAWLSAALMIFLGVLLACGLAQPGKPSVGIEEVTAAGSIASGMCYGGFNAALAAPVMALAGRELSGKQTSWTAGLFTLALTFLMALAAWVLVCHGEVTDAALPFVSLASVMGKGGFVLAAAVMYLASLTTLAACLRGLTPIMGAGAAWGSVALLSVLGMDRIVDAVYPALGAACLVLLTASLLSGRRKM